MPQSETVIPIASCRRSIGIITIDQLHDSQDHRHAEHRSDQKDHRVHVARDHGQKNVKNAKQTTA